MSWGSRYSKIFTENWRSKLPISWKLHFLLNASILAWYLNPRLHVWDTTFQYASFIHFICFYSALSTHCFTAPNCTLFSYFSFLLESCQCRNVNSHMLYVPARECLYLDNPRHIAYRNAWLNAWRIAWHLAWPTGNPQLSRIHAGMCYTHSRAHTKRAYIRATPPVPPFLS